MKTLLFPTHTRFLNPPKFHVAQNPRREEENIWQEGMGQNPHRDVEMWLVMRVYFGNPRRDVGSSWKEEAFTAKASFFQCTQTWRYCTLRSMLCDDSPAFRGDSLEDSLWFAVFKRGKRRMVNGESQRTANPKGESSITTSNSTRSWNSKGFVQKPPGRQKLGRLSLSFKCNNCYYNLCKALF